MPLGNRKIGRSSDTTIKILLLEINRSSCTEVFYRIVVSNIYDWKPSASNFIKSRVHQECVSEKFAPFWEEPFVKTTKFE